MVFEWPLIAFYLKPDKLKISSLIDLDHSSDDFRHNEPYRITIYCLYGYDREAAKVQDASRNSFLRK